MIGPDGYIVDPVTPNDSLCGNFRPRQCLPFQCVSFFQSFALFSASVLLALATLPWWLGALLRPLAQAQGVTFSRYERLGYARFRLHDVEFVRNQVRVTVDRIESATPALWLLAGERSATAGDWKDSPIVESHRSPPPAPTTLPVCLPSTHFCSELRPASPRWLPSAQLGAGEIHWPGQTLPSCNKRNWPESPADRPRTPLAETIRGRHELLAGAGLPLRCRS